MTRATACTAARATVRVLGRRNVGYMAFTLAMGLLGSILDSTGTHGPNGGGEGLAAIMLWLLVSLVFVPANGMLLLSDLLFARERARPAQALFACALPFIVAAVAMGGA